MASSSMGVFDLPFPDSNQPQSHGHDPYLDELSAPELGVYDNPDSVPGAVQQRLVSYAKEGILAELADTGFDDSVSRFARTAQIIERSYNRRRCFITDGEALEARIIVLHNKDQERTEAEDIEYEELIRICFTDQEESPQKQQSARRISGEAMVDRFLRELFPTTSDVQAELSKLRDDCVVEHAMSGLRLARPLARNFGARVRAFRCFREERRAVVGSVEAEGYQPSYLIPEVFSRVRASAVIDRFGSLDDFLREVEAAFDDYYERRREQIKIFEQGSTVFQSRGELLASEEYGMVSAAFRVAVLQWAYKGIRPFL